MAVTPITILGSDTDLATPSGGDVAKFAYCNVADLPALPIGHKGAVAWVADDSTPYGSGCFAWQASDGTWKNAFGGTPTTTLNHQALSVVTISGAQTISGTKTFDSGIGYTGPLTIAAISAVTTNDYAITSDVYIHNISATIANATITGIVAAARTGKLIKLVNTGSNYPIVFSANDTRSLASSRFSMLYDKVLEVGESVDFYHNGSSWVLCGGSIMPDTVRSPVFHEEFIGSTTGPYSFLAIGAGTIAFSPASGVSLQRIGVARLSSAAAAGSGYRVMLSETSMMWRGGMEFACGFRMGTLSANHSIRMGFHNSTNGSAATNGVHVLAKNAALTFELNDNNATATTSLAFTTALTSGVWYKIVIKGSKVGTAATASLYDFAGILLESKTIAVPAGFSAATKLIGSGVAASTAAATLASIVELDFVKTTIGGEYPLNR